MIIMKNFVLPKVFWVKSCIVQFRVQSGVVTRWINSTLVVTGIKNERNKK